MRIDNKSLSRAEVEKINPILDRCWNSPKTKTVQTKEAFIQASCGPDAIELLNGGLLWIVCDRKESGCVFYYDYVTYVADRQLFKQIKKYSKLRDS